jgi:hypothetical protein
VRGRVSGVGVLGKAPVRAPSKVLRRIPLQALSNPPPIIRQIVAAYRVVEGYFLS